MLDNVWKRAVILLAAFSILTSITAVEAQTYTLKVPELRSIQVNEDGAPVAIDGLGTYHRVSLSGSKIVLRPNDAERAPPLPANALPDAVVVVDNTGRRAWLDQPTNRYGHAVLGDGIEAGGLTVQHKGGTRTTLTLGPDAVFEDRYPRFADMDGDGTAEILVVKAYLIAGGALVLVDPGTADGKPAIAAEAPAIGIPNRWLNPVGAGDVDGDGRIEALVVITPHIGGTLTAYEWRDDKLVVDHAIRGFSNHAIGARELALSAIADLNGDGTPEAIVPDAGRGAMMVVSFIYPEPRIIAQVRSPGRIAHRTVVQDVDGDGVPEITFGTHSDLLVVWKPTF